MTPMDWKKLYSEVDQWAADHRQEFIDDISEVCRIRSVSIKIGRASCRERV